MNDYSVRFYGFSPTQDVHALFKERLEELLELAPGDSRIRATVHKSDESFRGLIHVRATVGEFTASASSQNVKKLAQKLTVQMGHQLKKWKGRRFDQDEDHQHT